MNNLPQEPVDNVGMNKLPQEDVEKIGMNKLPQELVDKIASHLHALVQLDKANPQLDPVLRRFAPYSTISRLWKAAVENILFRRLYIKCTSDYTSDYASDYTLDYMLDYRSDIWEDLVPNWQVLEDAGRILTAHSGRRRYVREISFRYIWHLYHHELLMPGSDELELVSSDLLSGMKTILEFINEHWSHEGQGKLKLEVFPRAYMNYTYDRNLGVEARTTRDKLQLPIVPTVESLSLHADQDRTSGALFLPLELLHPVMSMLPMIQKSLPNLVRIDWAVNPDPTRRKSLKNTASY